MSVTRRPDEKSILGYRTLPCGIGPLRCAPVRQRDMSPKALLVLLAAMAVLIGFNPSAQAQERVRPFTKVEGWRVSTLIQNGKPAGCVAVSNFVDGTTFIIGFGARWWLGLNNQSWSRHGTRALQVQILVDGRPVQQAAAMQKDRLVVMEFGDTQDRVAALMAGQTITFLTSMGRSSFSLRGSARAMGAVVDCIKSRGTGAFAGPGTGTGNDGAFGGKSTSSLPGRKVADRAQTLELATTYLAKLGTPYTVLEASSNVLHNFPVNWKFPDGGFGGMAIFTGAHQDVQKLFDEFVADNARLCKGTSGLQRQAPAVGEKKVVRYSAIGTCQEADRAYLTDYTLLVGFDVVVAIVNIGTGGGEGMQQWQEKNKKWSL